MTNATDTIAPRITFDLDIAAPYAELFKANQIEVSAAFASALLVIFGYGSGTPARVRMNIAGDTVLKGVHTLELTFPRTPEDMEVRGVLIGVTTALLVTLGKAAYKGQDFNQPKEAALLGQFAALKQEYKEGRKTAAEFASDAGRIKAAFDAEINAIEAAIVAAEQSTLPPAPELQEAAAAPMEDTAEAAPAYKLFAVQENSEVYAAESAEQARAYVSALIGEDVPEDEVWEVDGNYPMSIYADECLSLLKAAGLTLPEPETLRVIITRDGGAALYLKSGGKAEPTPRPLYLAEVEVSKVYLTQNEVAAAEIADGKELPFLVSTSYY